MTRTRRIVPKTYRIKHKTDWEFVGMSCFLIGALMCSAIGGVIAVMLIKWAVSL